MKILDKYQLKQIAYGFLFTGFVLMAIVWLTQSLKIMDMIVSNGISLWSFLKLTFLVLPNFIIIISPIVVFVVCLFCYSRMSVDRELHVLRAIGMSSFRISRPALFFALIITLVNYAMVFYFIPTSFSAFRSLQWELRYDVSNILIKEGEFVSLENNFNLFIKNRDEKGNLQGIMINDNRTSDKKTTTLAEKGALINSNGIPKIILENGIRQENSLNSERFSTLQFDKYLIDFGLIEKNADNRTKKPKEMFVWDLLTLTEKDGFSASDIRKFRVEAHSRFVKPLYNILFYIIACVGILASSFSRYGQTKSMIFSIAAMVTLQSLQIALENIADGNLSYLPLLYLNVFVPMAIGIYILKNDNIATAWQSFTGKIKKQNNEVEPNEV